MEPKDALQEFKEIFAMTSAEEQRITQILGQLWESEDDVIDIADMTHRVDPPPIRYTIPNIYV